MDQINSGNNERFFLNRYMTDISNSRIKIDEKLNSALLYITINAE